LGGAIRFEFYRDSTTRPKTDIDHSPFPFGPPDDRWKAIVHLAEPWSDTAGSGTEFRPPEFYDEIQPQKSFPSWFAAFASMDT